MSVFANASPAKTDTRFCVEMRYHRLYSVSVEHLAFENSKFEFAKDGQKML